MSGGPIGISCNLNGLSAEDLDFLKAHVAKFKEEREFWRTAECRILADTGSMLVLQYNDPAFKTVRLQAIASKIAQGQLRMYPQLPADKVYTLSDETKLTAAELMRDGVTVTQSLHYKASNRRMQEIILKEV